MGISLEHHLKYDGNVMDHIACHQKYTMSVMIFVCNKTLLRVGEKEHLKGIAKLDAENTTSLDICIFNFTSSEISMIIIQS